jgi:Heavy metal associated domain 2
MRLEDVRLVHAIPGRARFKIESLKGDDHHAEEIQQELSVVRGIDHFVANPLTGSVLIQYDPVLAQSLEFQLAVGNALGITLSDLDPSRLAAWYAGRMDGSPSAESSLGHTLQDLGNSLDSSLATLMRRGVDLRTLIPLGLFFLGLRSVLVAEKLALPFWYDYWWFAFSSYFILHNSTVSKSNLTMRE